MKAMLVASGMLISCLIAGTTSAQSESAAVKGNALFVFEKIASEFDIGFFDVSRFERTMQELGLSKEKGGDEKSLLGGGPWARYRGSAPNGDLVAYGAFPGALDETRNTFWVSFVPATEMQMPDAVVAHLLRTADKTLISGGDSIEAEFSQKPYGRCTKVYTLRIRLTTGALMRNTAEGSCPAIKPKR